MTTGSAKGDRLDQILALVPTAAELMESGTELAAITSLRAQGIDPGLVRGAIEQANLRANLHASRPQYWPADWLFTRDGAEQASHPLVAQFHASVVADCGVRQIADLTAGIGTDSAALAHRGIEVIAIEMDSPTFEILEHNLRGIPNIRIIDGDSELIAPDCQAYFVDPARRSGVRSASGARALPERDPQKWSPPLSSVMKRSRTANVFMKAAPAFEPPDGWARYHISLDRTLVETFTTNAQSGTFAVIIDSTTSTTTVIEKQNQHNDANNREQVIGDFLFELDPAISRAHLADQLAQQHKMSTLGSRDMWLSGNSEVGEQYSNCWRRYRVHESFPVKELAQRVTHLPGVAIKSKDSQQDFTAVRKASRKPDHNVWAVVITSISGREHAVLVSREQN